MFKKYSDRLRFALISTIVAFLVGLYLTTISIAGGHIWFFLSAPISTYLPCYYLWTWTMKSFSDYKIIHIIGLSIILTILTHYLNFVVLGVGRILGFHIGWHYEYESLLKP